MMEMPGRGYWLVAERQGKIQLVSTNRANPNRQLFADFKKLHPATTEVYSLTFHPGFATNRYVFIWYILEVEKPEGTRIARFEVSTDDPPRLLTETEEIVFTWKSGGHNGGAIRFGPEGYLYISTGDGSGPVPPDALGTGQNLDDLLSCILRVDVDRRDSGKTYRIPPDNPFVDRANARGEIWAYGFRNPWRYCFHPLTGELWAGDVGWELWEMIFKVRRGGNYGWSAMEGTRQPVRRDLPIGPTPILPPVVEHSHDEAASITGGEFYFGSNFPELRGSYVYADFEMGTIWELRMEGDRVAAHRVLAGTRHKLVSFGRDQAGELYIVDLDGGIYELARNPEVQEPAAFPRRLSETGLFEDSGLSKAAAGIYAYEIVAEKWQDGASGQRLLAIPGSAVAAWNEGRWSFPAGTVIAKTYSLESERGKTESKKRIETQVLHLQKDRWIPYTYRWRDDESDAELVAANGDERLITVQDSAFDGGNRVQRWRFNSRSECLRCHNYWCRTLLAVDEGQVRSGTVDILLPPRTNQAAHKLVNPHDGTIGIDLRARSYLHVNCSPCHRENAGGSVMSFMNIDMPLRRAGLTNKPPVQGGFGIGDPKVVAPGVPERSVLYYRMAKSGSGHMPLIGSTQVDPEGVELIYQWIRQMDQTSGPVGLPAPESEVAGKFDRVETAIDVMRGLDQQKFPKEVRVAMVGQAAQARPLVKDLFTRFLPEEQRSPGGALNPGEVLRLRGNAAAGRELFRSENSGQCKSCHAAEGVGTEFGPAFETIAAKYPPDELLRHIFKPSDKIDPEYVAWTVEDRDENAFSGFIREQSEGRLTLLTQHGLIRFEPGTFKAPVRQRQSLMPEGLVEGQKAQDLADLLAYFAALGKAAQ